MTYTYFNLWLLNKLKIITNKTFGGLLCRDSAFFGHQHFGSPSVYIFNTYPEDGNSMFFQSLEYHLAGYKVPYIGPKNVNLQRRLNFMFHRKFRLLKTVLLNSTGSFQSNFHFAHSRYTSWPILCTYFSNLEVAVSENNCYFLSCNIVQCSSWVQTFKMNLQPLFYTSVM